MDRRISLILSALILVTLLLIAIVFISSSPTDGSRVTSSSLQNFKDSEIKQFNIEEYRNDYSNSGILIEQNSEEIINNQNKIKIELGCFNNVDQTNGQGECNSIELVEKKCYKTIRSGCVDKKIEISCFEPLEQIKGEGYCFGVEQEKKECYNAKIKGCNTVLKETSCFSSVPQVSGEGPCSDLKQKRNICDARERKGICS